MALKLIKSFPPCVTNSYDDDMSRYGFCGNYERNLDKTVLSKIILMAPDMGLQMNLETILKTKYNILEHGC